MTGSPKSNSGTGSLASVTGCNTAGGCGVGAYKIELKYDMCIITVQITTSYYHSLL